MLPQTKRRCFLVLKRDECMDITGVGGNELRRAADENVPDAVGFARIPFIRREFWRILLR